MKSTIGAVAIVIAIAVFATLIGNATADNAPVEPNTAHVHDQTAQNNNPIGRFQISSFALQNGSGPGYYVIDSTTGEIWMNYGLNKPSKISESLLK